MILSRRSVPTARVALVAALVIAVLAQLWIVPNFAADAATQYPEHASLAGPYVLVIGIAIGFFELALISAWQLLSASVAGGASRRRGQWATFVTLALVSSGLIFAGFFIHVGFVSSVGGPPVVFGLLAALAVVVLAVVLRRRASELTVEAVA